MTLARDLPVYSPVSLSAILAGLRALLGADDEARARVEELIRAEYAPRGLLLTDSGTSALNLALAASARSLGNRPSKLLAALPAYCCYDIATAADAAGVRVVLYDLDPDTLGPDWISLERALAAGATAVVVAHLYGVPVDMRRVCEICRGRAHVIEDAAQAAGATIRGGPAGSFGSLSILSFGRGKGRTGGGGGALLANDPLGAQLLAGVSGLPGRARRGGRESLSLVAQWLLARPRVYGVPSSLTFLGLGETRYQAAWSAEGCPPACAAVLAAGWSAAEQEMETRSARAERLAVQARGSASYRVPQLGEGVVASYLRFPVVVSEEARTGAHALYSLGVMPGYPAALCDLPGFGERCVDIGESYAGARLLSRRLVTLPVHGRLLPGSSKRLEEWLGAQVERTPVAPAGGVAR